MPIEEKEEDPSMKSTGFWVYFWFLICIFKNPDPGFFVTSASVVSNLIISNMLLYGLTGRARLSYMLSMMTVPCSVILCIRDSRYDFERWKELRPLRQKGIPDRVFFRFMPYKCKYDWSEFEKFMDKKRSE